VTALLLALVLSHESGVSSSRLEMRGGEVRATFTFSLEDLAGLARLDADRNGLIDSAEWARVLPAIAAYVGDHFRIEGCRSEGDAEQVPAAVRSRDLRTPITLGLRYVPDRPLDRLKIRCDLFREHGGSPRHIAEFPGGETVIFDSDRREAERPLTPGDVRWWWIPAAALLPAAAIIALRLGSLT
jgi:hypothetical protein